MRRLGTICVALVALLGCASSAMATPGSLDPSFGQRGKVLLPGKGLHQVADMPDGRTVVVRASEIVALLPSGEIDPGFGEAGVSRIPWPQSLDRHYFSSLLVDPLGRIVVLGNGTLASTPGSDDLSWRVLIMRLTPQGAPDPSFSDDGVLVTDFAEFGVPAPVPYPAGSRPGIWGWELALDAQDRLVLTGSRTDGPSCMPNKLGGVYVDRAPFVARLLENGHPDASLGGKGAIAMDAVDALSQPMLDPYGNVYLTAYTPVECKGAPPGRWLVRLLPQGTLDKGFGSDGWRRLVSGGIGEMLPRAVDRSGRVLLTGYAWGSRERGIPSRVIVRRLRRDGSLDTSFGHEGTALAPGAHVGRQMVAVDANGGILVAANLDGRRGSRQRVPQRPGVLLARLRPNGDLDRRFGNEGIVRIRLGRERGISLRSLALAGPNRVLVAATWGSVTGRKASHGTVLHRFVLGGS